MLSIQIGQAARASFSNSKRSSDEFLARPNAQSFTSTNWKPRSTADKSKEHSSWRAAAAQVLQNQCCQSAESEIFNVDILD